MTIITGNKSAAQRGGIESGPPASAQTHEEAHRPPFACGQIIPGLLIGGRPAPYPVVNERAVRATAGLLLIAAAAAFALAFFHQNFLPLKIVTPILFLDFVLRTFTGLTPLSPFGVAGSFLVRHLRPEWVGATQKRFAWSIGIAVALLMSVITNLDITGAVPLAFCMICMALMWMEAALGICVGCLIYQWLVQRGVLAEAEHPPACAGDACESPHVRG